MMSCGDGSRALTPRSTCSAYRERNPQRGRLTLGASSIHIMSRRGSAVSRLLQCGRMCVCARPWFFRVRRPERGGARALVARHLLGMYEASPPESVHAFDVSKLLHPDVTFWSAWAGDAIAGCGALKALEPTRGEIDSMRVADAFLGRGVGRAILEHIIAEARTRRMYEPLARDRLVRSLCARPPPLRERRASSSLRTLRRLRRGSVQRVHDAEAVLALEATRIQLRPAT